MPNVGPWQNFPVGTFHAILLLHPWAYVRLVSPPMSNASMLTLNTLKALLFGASCRFSSSRSCFPTRNENVCALTTYPLIISPGCRRRFVLAISDGQGGGGCEKRAKRRGGGGVETWLKPPKTWLKRHVLCGARAPGLNRIEQRRCLVPFLENGSPRSMRACPVTIFRSPK